MNENDTPPVAPVPGGAGSGTVDALRTVVERLGNPEKHVRAKNGRWVTVDEPLTEAVLVAHVAGEQTVGAHPAADSVARAGIIDIDLHLVGREPTADEVAAVEEYAVRKYDELHTRGVTALLVRGHAAGSYHIWFWAVAVAATLGQWLRDFVTDAGEIHVDTFPAPTGGGNAVRLPGRHHRRPDEWSAAWNGADWVPWPAAIHRLAALPDNRSSLFPAPKARPKPQPPKATASARPGDVFNLHVPVEDVLTAYGWTIDHSAGDRIYLTRPGKDSGVSASVQDGTVWVFTSAVPELPASEIGDKPYTAFAVLAYLQFGGDFGRAARELGRAGYGASVSPVPPYVPFPLACLPPIVRAYVRDTAAAMSCDPAYSALPALAALGAAIGGSHVISPKDGWREPPYIWAVTVGRSGAMKSPPYRDVEDIAEDVNDRLEQTHKSKLEVYEADDADENEEGDSAPRDARPIKKAFIKGDVTIEALVTALQANPRGLLIGQDELNAWIGGFVKYSGKSGASDLPRWLQLSNAGTLNYTRKTGDPETREVRVRVVGVSVTGTIQPRTLARAMTDEFRAAGLAARLLVAMPPWRQRQWTEEVVAKATRDAFAGLVGDLHALPPGAWPDEPGRPRPHLVRPTAEAKALFIAFSNANGQALASADEDAAAALSKLEGYALRFALIFHCCRHGKAAKDIKVAAVDMSAAVRLTEWFRDEAERIYVLLGQTDEQRAVRHVYEVVCRLADRFAAKRNGFRGVTARDLQNSNSKRYSTRAEAELALESLVAAGLGEWSDGPEADRVGGHKPRYFEPRPTSDTSDTRSAEDGDGGPDDAPGGSDTRSDGPPPPAPPGGSECAASHLPASASDATQDDGCEQVSEVSDVGREQLGGDGDGTDGKRDETATEVERRTPGASVGRDPLVTIVTDAAGLPAVVAAVKNSAGLIGLDTETTGLDPRTDRVRLIQIAIPDAVYVIDLFAIGDVNALAELFAALAEVECAGHNLQFDLRFLAPLGFVVGRVYDTLLASQVLHAGRVGRSDTRISHALGDVVQRELAREINKGQQLSDWSGALSADQIRYAALDAAVLLPLAAALKGKLASVNLTATAELEMRALPAVAWLAGVPINRTAWDTQVSCATADRDRFAAELAALDAGASNRNWNSPAQVKAAFVAVGVKIDSTADDTLATVDHPLAVTLRGYRSAAKRVSSYGEKWAAEHVRDDGRVYSSWRQLSQVTGRIGCSGPNLQQVPRSYRGCIAAPAGSVLIKADYSQIELRIAAKLTGDDRMIAAYRDGEDLHTLTAATVLKKAVANVAKSDRQLAKALNFGLLYGMSADTLMASARTQYGVTFTLAEARQFRKSFFRLYPGLKRWHASVGNTTIATRTLGGRRRLRVERFAEKLNSPVQGTGADGLKAAISLLPEQRAECPRAVPILYVHDEIVVEVPEVDAEVVKAWLVTAMTDGMTPLLAPVPVAVEVTVGRTWAGD